MTAFPGARRPVALLLSLLAAAVLMTAAAPRAAAHPHAWIDVRIKVLFDKQKRIYALEETWIFDPLYTAFSLEGVKRDKNGAPDQKVLDALMQVNMNNVKAFDYMTQVVSDGAKSKFSGVRDVKSSEKNKRLLLTFTLLLDKPVNATKGPVEYAVFDPTYYIEMLHAEGGGAIELVGADPSCNYRLIPPNPNPNAVAFAASIDYTHASTSGLGELFAEHVIIRCGGKP